MNRKTGFQVERKIWTTRNRTTANLEQVYPRAESLNWATRTTTGWRNGWPPNRWNVWPAWPTFRCTALRPNATVIIPDLWCFKCRLDMFQRAKLSFITSVPEVWGTRVVRASLWRVKNIWPTNRICTNNMALYTFVVGWKFGGFSFFYLIILKKFYKNISSSQEQNWQCLWACIHDRTLAFFKINDVNTPPVYQLDLKHVVVSIFPMESGKIPITDVQHYMNISGRKYIYGTIYVF